MSLNAELIHPSRTAVIVIDVQNDFCHPNGAFKELGLDFSMVPDMMSNLRRLLPSARSRGVPVIFIQTLHEKATDSAAWTGRQGGVASGICRTGTWGAEFYEIAPEEDDIVVVKHRYSAFIHTRLESVLRTLKAETLILTGITTNVCVESTARDGFMLDYNVVLAPDACATYNRAAHEATLYNIRGFFGTVADTQDVIDIWENPGLNR